MKAIKALLVSVVVLFCPVANADIITVDSSSWTQSKKNEVKTVFLRVLYDAGITHGGVNVNLPNIEVVNPSAPIGFITKPVLQTEYQEWLDEREVARLFYEAKQAERSTELSAHDMRDITKDQIISRIDSISNLNQMKAFQKKFVKFLWARGYFDSD